jgi:hypothetical protein
MKARELGWINRPPTEADALGGSFVRC